MKHFVPSSAVLPLASLAGLVPSSLVLRRLETSEDRLAVEHLLRLDERSRRFRFAGSVGDGVLRDHVSARPGQDVVRLGLFADGMLRGLAELYISRGQPTGAEVAFSLEAAFQGLGYGRRLVEAMLEEAGRRGIEAVTLHSLRENVAMRRIARRLGGEIGLDGADFTAVIPVPDALRTEPALLPLAA